MKLQQQHLQHPRGHMTEQEWQLNKGSRVLAIRNRPFVCQVRKIVRHLDSRPREERISRLSKGAIEIAQWAAEDRIMQIASIARLLARNTGKRGRKTVQIKDIVLANTLLEERWNLMSGKTHWTRVLIAVKNRRRRRA
jgi:histone H3/H4